VEIPNTSKMLAGVILVTVPTIEYGGSFLLGMLRRAETGYVDNALEHDLLRAGHTHAGVMVLLSLIRQLLSVGRIAVGYGANANDLARLYRCADPGGGDPGAGSRANP
jgi:hypothetical protein